MKRDTAGMAAARVTTWRLLPLLVVDDDGGAGLTPVPAGLAGLSVGCTDDVAPASLPAAVSKPITAASMGSGTPPRAGGAACACDALGFKFRVKGFVLRV